MKHENFCYVATAVIVAAWALAPASSEARQNLNIQFPEGATRCADLRVSSGGRVAQAAESFTVTRNQAAVVEVSGLDRGQIHARGWDRPDYSVEACKIASADSQVAADALLKGVSVTNAGGRFSASGPSADGSDWQVVFIVQAPRGASLDLETRNGPIDARGIAGTLKTRTANGPIALGDCSGTIEAHADNGPISMTGGSGDVQLNANNGPISLKLSADDWSGPRLEAHTTNGPVSAELPNTFRSGVRVETAGHTPVSCRMDACSNALTDASGNRRVMDLNGSSATVRLSTGNGPVSLGAAGAGRRVI